MTTIKKISKDSRPVKRRRLGTLLLEIFLSLVALIQLFPLIWMLFFSLKTNEELFGANVVGLPWGLEWENYSRVFADGNIGRYLINSTIIALVTILATGFLSAMAAFAVTRMKWRLSKAVYVVFLMGMMVPVHATLLPLFITLKPVLNTYWALIIPYIGFALPLSFLVLSGYCSAIPRELEESACLDGANIYQIFGVITVPLIRPALATVSILTYLSSWNELMFAITFVNREIYKTVPFGIMSMEGRYATKWGPIGAGLVVATIPTIILYVMLSEQIQSSLAAGALKG